MTTEEVAARFPWKKVFERLDMKYDALSDTDRKKLWSYLEDNLTGWSSKQKAFGGSKGNASFIVDPHFLENVKTIHETMKAAGNAIDFAMLCGMFAAATNTQPTKGNLDHIREQMRVYINTHPQMFKLMGKGIASVYRLTDAKGKPTNVEVPVPKEPGSSPDVNGETGFRGFSKPFQNAATRAGVDNTASGYDDFKSWATGKKKKLNSTTLAEYAKYQTK